MDDARIAIADGGDVLRMCRREFHIEGYEAAEASDCDALLTLVEAWNPHLILLDLEMPTGEGWDCLQRIHSDERASKVPLLALTSDEGNVMKARDAGAREVLLKPLGPITLLHAVRDGLRAGGAA